MLSTTHQETPQTITQPQVVNVYHDDNHELVQSFDEVVSTRQPWQSTILGYNLPITEASTPITTFVGNPPTKHYHQFGKMERLHLLNKLEQLCHIDQRLFNQ
jgi:hypothetical protein